MIRPVTATAALLRAPNPSPMTLSGTNSWVLRAQGAATSVVVDPGPDDAAHLATLAETAPELILITHHHNDHTGGAARLHELTGAPVRAFDPAQCLGAAPLAGPITAAGLTIDVLPTPGHTADSVCFDLGDAVVTGDTILGDGTAVIAAPDGSVGPYLASLRLLRERGRRRAVLALPGHGPVRPDLAATAAAYLDHRAQRLDQIRTALARLGADAGTGAVTDAVYPDVTGPLRTAAEWSVAAQLEYLRGGPP